MRKLLILASGWAITVVGAVLTPIPLPLPFPLGIMMFLAGCAILTTHSKAFRRALQYIRHHNGWLSRGLEQIARRAPARIKAMVHRTSPSAHGRRARMRAGRADDAV